MLRTAFKKHMLKQASGCSEQHKHMRCRAYAFWLLHHCNAWQCIRTLCVCMKLSFDQAFSLEKVYSAQRLAKSGPLQFAVESSSCWIVILFSGVADVVDDFVVDAASVCCVLLLSSPLSHPRERGFLFVMLCWCFCCCWLFYHMDPPRVIKQKLGAWRENKITT